MMRFFVEHLIEKRIYSIVCIIFVLNMAWLLKCENVIYLLLKFIKLFCKHNFIIAGTVVACYINSEIHVKSQINCVVLVVFTKINADNKKKITMQHSTDGLWA
jgi:uncharacterized membrane protein YesL